MKFTYQQPYGTHWSFIAMEYYLGILHRTYQIFVTPTILAGAFVTSVMAAPLGLPRYWFAPSKYANKRRLEKYEQISPESDNFKSYSPLFNFQYQRTEIRRFWYDPIEKWGMGAVAHSGKLYMELSSGRKREFILVENLVLTEKQLQALERAKEFKEAHGEIETEHPGYLGAQDTYYVGTIKGVGRIYQQTFVDTYTKMAFAKLYDRKNALVAADLLNDRVLPFFEQEGIRLLRIMTDRGTEYVGSLENHEYELYLAIEDIDHTKTKARSPQTNGICERFHRTIQDEFYAIAFRKKIYHSIEELQTDLDQWLQDYNQERTHSGKYCFGKTPYQTFQDEKPLVKEKMRIPFFREQSKHNLTQI